jgi:hypothetical protein
MWEKLGIVMLWPAGNPAIGLAGQKRTDRKNSERRQIPPAASLQSGQPAG